MNYRSAGIAEIEAISIQFPEYTLGQILCAITSRKTEGMTIRAWLLQVSDEDLYTDIEKTKIIEKDY